MITELEERRAMASFEGLFTLAIEKPEDARILLDKHCQSPNRYPMAHNIFFMMGVLRGMLIGFRSPWLSRPMNTADLEAIKIISKEIHKLKTHEYIGEKRKYARV